MIDQDDIMVCDLCDRTLTDDETARAWPVPVPDPDGEDPTQDYIYVCPDCYRGTAYCAEGHLLRGDVGSTDCDECRVRVHCHLMDGAWRQMPECGPAQHGVCQVGADLPEADVEVWVTDA